MLIPSLFLAVGEMPTTPAEFTWWCAEVMPVEDHVKVALLSLVEIVFSLLPPDHSSSSLWFRRITSVRERLRLIVFWIEQFRSSWWYSRGCKLLFPLESNRNCLLTRVCFLYIKAT